MENKKLNIGVIGCSPGMGEVHLKGISKIDSVNIYAVCDPATDNRVEICKERYGAERAEKDYKELLDDPKLDAVVIVTPDQTHCEITTAFLRAGKPVLCEKPMALSIEECVEMMKVEKETGTPLMIGQICRFTDNFVQTKKLIDEGAIGELFFVESEYAHSYLKSRGYNEWRVTPERDGFIGGGCHAVDFLRWVAGDPTEVYALSNHKCLTDWPTNDCTVALFKFPNDVNGKVFASIGCTRPYTMRSVFYGTKGTIICDNRSDFITLYNKNQHNWAQIVDGGEKIKVKISDHNTTGEVEMFANALLNNEKIPVTSMEGAKTVVCARAAVQSAKENRPVIIEYPEI